MTDSAALRQLKSDLGLTWRVEASHELEPRGRPEVAQNQSPKEAKE